MKTLAYNLPRAWLAFLLTFAATLAAQDAAPPAKEESAPAAPPAATAPATPQAQPPPATANADAPAAEPVTPATAQTTETEAASAPAAPTAPSVPESASAPAAPAADEETAAATATATAAAEEAGEKELRRIDEPDREGAQKQNRRNRQYRRGGDDVPFGDHVIAQGSRTDEAVSVFGSTTVEGIVHSDAVSILGDTTVAEGAEVHGAAVAIMGRMNMRGRTYGEVVNVLGATVIDGPVGGEAVAVMSDIHLGPNAVIEGDLVVVGGVLTRDPAAIVRGNHVTVTIPVIGSIGGFEGISVWFKKCLLLGRLLAFDPRVMWAWWIALGFLAFYVVLGLLFRSSVDKCVETFETRPGSTLVASVLTVLLTPVLTILLVFTVVGAVVVPFLGIALFFATLFGKAVILAWLGRRITKLFGDGPLNHAAVAVIVGGIIMLGLYAVPVVGIVTYKLMGVLGLGVVVYTLILRSQREKVRPATAVAGAAAATPPVSIATPAPSTSPGFTGAAATSASMAAATIPPTPPTAAEAVGAPAFALPPPVSPPVQPAVPMTTLPRAGFWIRTGALALDVILVAVVLGLLSELLPRPLRLDHGPSSLLMALAIYGAILWKLKGTTIGGIVCGLKVVRVDGREIDWATAVVRALGCFLSLIVAGLGFIWVVIDDDKQSWHDKIAGTTVVRVPKGVTLV